MWKYSFLERRCLIPLTAFAEAEGEAGRMTRTWFSLPDEPIFAAAGIWRESDEWGPVYSMIMTEACLHVADVHDRMPVLLKRSDWSDWLDGPSDTANLLCRRTPISWWSIGLETLGIASKPMAFKKPSKAVPRRIVSNRDR